MKRLPPASMIGLGVDVDVLADLGQVPDVEQAAEDLAKEAGNAAKDELLEALAIMAAGTAVPLLGNLGGLILVALKVLGPRIWKGITGAFKTKKNPWVSRFNAVDASDASALDRFRTLDVLRLQAKGLQDKLGALGKVGRSMSEYRWAKGAQKAAWARMLGDRAAGFRDLRKDLPVEARAVLIHQTEVYHRPTGAWSTADLGKWVETQYRMLAHVAPFAELALDDTSKALLQSQFQNAVALLQRRSKGKALPPPSAPPSVRRGTLRPQRRQALPPPSAPRTTSSWEGFALRVALQAAKQGRLLSSEPGGITPEALQEAIDAKRFFGKVNRAARRAARSNRIYWVAAA